MMKGCDMSHESNTNLIEQAREVAERYTGTPLQDAILNNLERNDLETVARLVKETDDYEQEEAHRDYLKAKYNLEEATDVY